MKLNQPNQYQHVAATGYEQLIQVQPGKNRRYTQLKSGKLEAEYAQAWLGSKAQVFRETLNVGARIEAAPPSNLLPFTFILPSSKNVVFCHKSMENTDVITQATGGYWDVVFSDNLEYVSAAFDREYFFNGYIDLKQEDVPESFLQSKTTPTLPSLAGKYSNLIANYLELLRTRPCLLDDHGVMSLMSSELLKSIIAALSEHKFVAHKLPKLKKRQRGVSQVIEYLNVFASDLPDMQTLCAVANLSERSLQYGFLELLGCTPIQYLRMVRLNGAKHSLEQSNPGQDKVVNIAMQWGFVELGRFAKDYKALFDELPSDTLSRF